MAGLGLFSSPDRERQDLEQYAASLPKPTEQASLMAKVLQTWPARLAQSAYSAATLPGEVLRNPDTAMDVLSGARDMSQETFNRATDLASIPMVATTGAPAGALGAGPVRPGIRAYHGSPHDFDRFDLSKIGTGEGAQAYGRGLYFAENEAVARGYRDALSPGMRDGALRSIGLGDAELRSLRQFTQSSADPDVALRDWLGWIGKRETPEIRQAFMREWEGRAPGRMYEVNINTAPERLLDWDAPVPRQSQLREMVGDWGQEYMRAGSPEARNVARDAMLAARNENLTGAGVYSQLTRLANTSGAIGEHLGPLSPPIRSGPAMASSVLRDQGIDGIRYLDAGSRAAGDGSRNYVVFDDAIIDILRKYGLAGLTAGGAVAASSGQSEAGQNNDPLVAALSAARDRQRGHGVQ